MKLRYMIDMILREGKGGQPVYEPVGVWVQGPGAYFGRGHLVNSAERGRV